MHLHRATEALDAIFRHRGIALLAVNIGDAPMPQRHGPVHQHPYAVDVVGYDAATIVEGVVDGDAGQVAVHQLRHLRRVKIHAGEAHTVHIAIATVFQIGHIHRADVVVDERDVIAPALHLGLEGIQHGCEKGMRQSADVVIDKKYAQVEAAIGLQGPGQCVGTVADLVGGFHHLPAGGLADIRVAVEHLADRGYGHTAAACDILDGHRHMMSSLLPQRSKTISAL